MSGPSGRDDESPVDEHQFEQGGLPSSPPLSMPKKGILKRVSSGTIASDIADARGKIPIREFRPSPDRFPERTATRIPKLSLTWSEKNAIAFFGDTTSDENATDHDEVSVTGLSPFPPSGTSQPAYLGTIRQTAILQDDDESEELEIRDERMGDDEGDELSDFDDRSVTSTSSASHIAGKWWFGKSTKYIPHCAKRGCTHLNSDCGGAGEYLTPTQRRTKEIHLLRKQLKLAVTQLGDKEAHLSELREKLGELETVIESSNSLSESHRLMARQREQLIKSHDREKERLIEKHEIRVRQLIQEAVDSRTEILKLNLALKELRERKKSVADKETMTEILEMTPDAPTPRIHPEPPLMSASFPPSPQQLTPAMTPIPQEFLLQLQAYQNEAVVWRTKAANLEIVLKEQIMKAQQSESIAELERYKSECERLRLQLEAGSPNRTMVDSGIEANLLTLSPEHKPSIVPERRASAVSAVPDHRASLVGEIRPSVGGECFAPLCIDRRKLLMCENSQLHEKVEEQSGRLNDLEEDLSLLRNTISAMEEEATKSSNALKSMSDDLEQSTAEAAAANLAIVRLQGELATKTKAINYLEERHQVYRNTILDNDLVVSDETSSDWRRGFSDPRYVVNLSKRVQTELTSEALSANETQFHNLHDKLKELEKEFSSKKSNMYDRFREIEENLLMKTQLVESLSRQLDESDKEALSSSKVHQKERETFQARLAELGRVAERVPLLEYEIDKLHQEKGILILQLQSTKEEFEAGLEASLGESLKKYQQQTAYWTEKMSVANSQNETLKGQIKVLEEEMENVRLRSKVEMADLTQRLTSSIDHVTQLNTKMNPTTRDVVVDAHPRVVSKYVACRPNARHKATEIGKGDLFDEVEERLKLCQGELNTTRRQVEVLQQKLVDNALVQAEDSMLTPLTPIVRVMVEKEVKPSDEGSVVEGDVDALREKVDELEKRNVDLAARMRDSEQQKQTMARTQRQQIAQLVTEFDNVRKELDQEIGKYESEQRRLKNRVEILEKAKLDRDRLIDRLRAIEGDGQATDGDVPIRVVVESPAATHSESEDVSEKETNTLVKRCQSVPHLGEAVGSLSDEMALLREHNSLLSTANARLTRDLHALRQSIESSIRRTVSRVSDVASHSVKSPSFRTEGTPHFADLATGLNQVRADLEGILDEIDKVADGRERLSCTPDTTSAPSSSKMEIPSALPEEIDRLRRSLKRSRAERAALSEQLDRVTLDFQDACRELDLYKHEPREETLKYLHSPRLPRSRSFVDLGRATVDLDEYVSWREKAGTMFRELNRVRKEHRACDAERRDLRLQLILTRGELGLAQCQIAELSTRPHSDSVHHALSQSTLLASSGDCSRTRKYLGARHSDVRESSGTYATANCSFYSLNDIASVSEPDLMDLHGELSARLHAPLRASGRGTSAREEGMRRFAAQRDEIVLEAARVQISSLRHQNERLRSEVLAQGLQQCSNSNSDENEKAISSDESLRSEIKLLRTEMMAESDRVCEFVKENESLREQLQLANIELESVKSSMNTRTAAFEKRDADGKAELQRLVSEFDDLKAQYAKVVCEQNGKRKKDEERLSMLSRENELFIKKMEEMEKERQEMYLVMFKKGKEAAEHGIDEARAVDQMTEDKIVLRFLHDAFYYYLLNKGDSREHLQAIMTMLNFSSQQKEDVYRKRGSSH